MVRTSHEGFPRSGRLIKRREFLHVQKSGRKIHLEDMLVFVIPGQYGQRKPRVGITVSRKVGKAVVRNRVKRLVREVWRRRRGLLPQGMAVVFVAKKTAIQMSYASLLMQFEHLAHRLERTAPDAAKKSPAG